MLSLHTIDVGLLNSTYSHRKLAFKFTVDLIYMYRIIPIKRPCPNKRPPMFFSIIRYWMN